MLDLQRTAGNRAVRSLLDTDGGVLGQAQIQRAAPEAGSPPPASGGGLGAGPLEGEPEGGEESKLGEAIEGTHTVLEALEIIEAGGVPGIGEWAQVGAEEALHLTPGAATSVGAGATTAVFVVGAITNLLGGLFAIGNAHQKGRETAAANAYRYGFASTIAAMAGGSDWTPDLPRELVGGLGVEMHRGRNAAIRLVTALGKKQGQIFLARYQKGGLAQVRIDIGGYYAPTERTEKTKRPPLVAQ